MGKSEGQIQDIKQARTRIVSIYEPMGDSEAVRGDFISDESVDVANEGEKQILSDEIDRLMNDSRLNEKEKQVINFRFGRTTGNFMTLQQVAEAMSDITGGKPVTRERIRQIESMALRKLRRVSAKRQTLLDFVE